MNKLILLVFIVAFIDSIIIIVVKTYNNLTRLRNVLNSNYADMSKELTYRATICRQYIPIVTPYASPNNISTLTTLLDEFNLKVSIVDLASLYYRINNVINDINAEAIIKGFSAPEWDKAFKDSVSRIEALRIIYDDNVLKMNNVVDLPGTSIVAKLFGFVKWPYFRNA
jgi:hypothetical protein